MSGSRPIPTPVPASETAAAWSRNCGTDWVARDDGKLFAKRPALHVHVRDEGQSESDRVIRALERQINKGRELSPPYQWRPGRAPAPPSQEHPEPVSGAAVTAKPTRAIGETEGQT